MAAQRTATPRHTILPVAIACLMLVGSRDAVAWVMREHRAIGAESYVAACSQLAGRKDRDRQTAQRYEVACGNLPIAAMLYGQGTSVSGDFISNPEELFSALGAAASVSRTNYLRLALTNGAHFHPLATREWREIHIQAIAEALAASHKQGAAQIEAFENAAAHSAFADHFLQDCFAAGHMGFNRPASSAAASLVYHDEWNKRGRYVVNRRGEAWVTYGDRLLDAPQNRESRRRVVVASTYSVYGVLVAFVLGEQDPEADFAVWREVPYTTKNEELVPTLEWLFGESEVLETPGMMPLLAIKRPARKDRVLGVWSSFSMSFDGDHPLGALVFGGDLAIPRVTTRVEGGVGLAFEDSTSPVGFAGDIAFVRTFGLSLDGLLSHEVDFGTLVMIGADNHVLLRLDYRINLEAGDILIRPEIGPAYDVLDNEWGFYVGFGISKTLSAVGGGFR